VIGGNTQTKQEEFLFEIENDTIWRHLQSQEFVI